MSELTGVQAPGLRGVVIVDVAQVRRLAEAHQVGHDHAVVRRQEARHPGEVVLVGAEAVHQHQRRAGAAFEVDEARAIGQRQLLAREARVRACLSCEPCRGD